MKSMKKLVSLALCTAMLGSTIPGMNIAAAETTGKTEFWNDKMANTDQSKLDQMQESIKDLSGIDVELIAYPDTASYQTAMQQSIRTEDAPGLFTWWSGSQLETLVKEGLVEDMTDFWDEYVIPNGVSADVAGSLTFDGKIYGVPYSIIYNTIIYNKDIFNQYGLEEPQTFDEFLTVCQTLLDNGVTPIALKSDSLAGFIWFQAMLAAYDPALYEGVCDGSIAYTDEKVVEVMNQWKDMLDKGYFSAPMTNVDMAKTLATGGVAMELEPNYEATTIVDDYGLVAGEDLGTFVLPSVDGAKKIVFYEIAPLCVSSASKDKDAAIEALKSWFTKENQTVFTDITGFLCSSQVTVDNECVNQMVAYTTDSDNYSMMLRYYENTPSDVRDVALDELMKFELGDAGVDEVLSTIQTKADEVFAK